MRLESLDAGGVRGHSASVGVAALEPDQSPEALLAAAGSALEQARDAGGGQAVLFAGDTAAARDEARLAGVHGDVIAALASTLGERDRYTGRLTRSRWSSSPSASPTSSASTPQAIGRLRTAALLHDIGKVGVPDEILHKPGALDEREWEIMRQHPVIGERIIRAIPGMGAVARIVRHEHERWDGGGYPDGLAGDGDPGRGADHPRLRRLPRDDLRSALPRGDSARDAIAELSGERRHPIRPAASSRRWCGYLYGRRQSGLAAV